MGHMLVDQIAFEQIGADTREKVGNLVRLLDNKYNDNIPYNFITAGCWMDDMRADPAYAYSKWHYIDIEYTPTGTPAIEPQPPHILSAIDELRAAFKNPAASDAQKAGSLAMLMHLVGDIHQPLHCVDWNNDRGGNAYLIYGIPFSDLLKKQIPNLHSYWDRAFRFDVENGKVVEVYYALKPNERPQDPAHGLIKDEAQRIAMQFPKTALYQFDNRFAPREWAFETHAIACLFAYPIRPHPTDTEVVTLTPDYVQHARAVANQRIALAGYRLAVVLGELFKK
jgi:hypothetical protein